MKLTEGLSYMEMELISKNILKLLENLSIKDATNIIQYYVMAELIKMRDTSLVKIN